jgi:hypothetical protein
VPRAAFKFKGYIAQNDEISCFFALPLFEKRGSLYVQEVSYLSNKVAGFCSIDLEQPFRAWDGPDISIGQPPVYVFVDERRYPHIGPIQDLVETLKAASRKGVCDITVRLQILDLIGNTSAARELSLILASDIRRRGGLCASSSFVRSTARSLVFDDVAASLRLQAITEEDGREVLRSISVIFGDEISISFHALPEAVNRAALEAAMQETREKLTSLMSKYEALNHELHASSRSYVVYDSQGSTMPLDAFLTDPNKISNWIKRHKQQEERLVLLAKELTRDPNKGLQVLTTYGSGETSTEKFVIALLRGTAEQHNLLRPVLMVELLLHAFSRMMARSRSWLLYHLVMHFSFDPQARALLLKRFRRRSTAAMTADMREHIRVQLRADR